MKVLNWQYKMFVFPWAILAVAGLLTSVTPGNFYGYLFHPAHWVVECEFAVPLLVWVNAIVLVTWLYLKRGEATTIEKSQQGISSLVLVPVVLLLSWTSSKVFGEPFFDLLARTLPGEVNTTSGTVANISDLPGTDLIVSFRLNNTSAAHEVRFREVFPTRYSHTFRPAFYRATHFFGGQQIDVTIKQNIFGMSLVSFAPRPVSDSHTPAM